VGQRGRYDTSNPFSFLILLWKAQDFMYSLIRIVTDSGKGVCVDPGDKGAILETGGPGLPERGKGSRQRRRRDIATWPPVQETDSPQLQETVMHRLSAIVHCTAVI
jgi:hypothetical protein